jgi:hypothetical protein
MKKQTESARKHRWLPLAAAGFLVAGLAVAALRVDLIRVRYGLADAVREEKALLEEKRQALARMRSLRDPSRLARLASHRGLARPERIIDLPAQPEQGKRP